MWCTIWILLVFTLLKKKNRLCWLCPQVQGYTWQLISVNIYCQMPVRHFRDRGKIAWTCSHGRTCSCSKGAPCPEDFGWDIQDFVCSFPKSRNHRRPKRGAQRCSLGPLHKWSCTLLILVNTQPLPLHPRDAVVTASGQDPFRPNWPEQVRDLFRRKRPTLANPVLAILI